MKSSRKAFTLLEILVAVVIIAVMAMLISMLFSNAVDQAKLTSCQANLRNLATGVAMYSSDNNNEWPYAIAANGAWTWSASAVREKGEWRGIGQIHPYLQNQQSFFCAADVYKTSYNNKPFEEQSTCYSSYVGRGLGQTYNWKGQSVDNRQAVGKYMHDVYDRAIASCFFLHIPNRANFPFSMHKDRWPVLYGDGMVAVCKVPDFVDINSPPDIWNTTRNQIRMFDSFDRN